MRISPVALASSAKGEEEEAEEGPELKGEAPEAAAAEEPEIEKGSKASEGAPKCKSQNSSEALSVVITDEVRTGAVGREEIEAE